jgi:hypothetical protein
VNENIRDVPDSPRGRFLLLSDPRHAGPAAGGALAASAGRGPVERALDTFESAVAEFRGR